MAWDLRFRFLKCFVWSTLMYGCETWTISGEMKKRIEAAEMWFIRRRMRISWYERITNEEVLRRAGTNRSIMNIIRSRQLASLGHDLRAGGIEKNCLMGMIEGKRARGRQRQTFIGSLLQVIEGGLRLQDIKRLVEDRKAWHSRVAHVRDMAPR